MQPETKVKENGQSVLEKLDVKIKENNSPAQQWDYLAFQVIYNELAPRGFKKQKNGFYKGAEYVEVPKKTVLKTQKIAAQLIRGFRDKAKVEINKLIDKENKSGEESAKAAIDCPFWKVLTRLRHKKNAMVSLSRISALRDSIDALNNTIIK